MAEEQIASEDNVLDNIVEELQKIQRLQSTTDRLYNRVDGIQDTIDDIKQTTGIQQDQKQKNIIKDDISATLSNNERKRYQNIGKEFVQGAGKQFSRIKKAISFKEKMQTKKDWLKQKIQIVKQNTKKALKSGSFWKKFLAVIAILGVVGFLFRDKIAKLLPDLSSGFQSGKDRIIEGIKNGISALVSNFKDVSGKSFDSVFTYAAQDLLPKMITPFFERTLPDAIVASVLAIMSTFSESAGDQLENFLGEGVEDHAHDTGERAQKQVENRRKAEQERQQLNSSITFANKTLEELAVMQNNWGHTFLQSYSDAFDSGPLSDLTVTIGGEQKTLGDLDDENNFNKNKFLLELQKAAEDNKVTNNQVINAIRASIIDQSNKNTIQVNLSGNDRKNDSLTELANNARTKYAQLQREMNNRTNAAAERYTEQIQNSEKEVERVAALRNNVTYKFSGQQFGKAIGLMIGEKYTNILENLNSILGSTQSAHSPIINCIVHFFDALATYCNNFMISALGSVTTMLDVIPAANQGGVPEKGQGVTLDIHKQPDIPPNVANVFSLNINIDDLYFRSYYQIITWSIQIQNSISKAIGEGNKKLQNLNKKLKNKSIGAGGNSSLAASISTLTQLYTECKQDVVKVNDKVDSVSGRVTTLEKGGSPAGTITCAATLS